MSRLTDKGIAALPAAPAGKRTEVWDDVVQGFGVRVTSRGHKSFVAYARFRGVPSRRIIGEVGKIGLADARAKARLMLEAALKGEDPAADAREARASTFGAAMEHYIAKHVRKQRRAVDTERELRRYLLSKWERRPIEEITKTDVRKLIEEIANRGAERQAHNIFGLCRTFFNWCLETDRVKASPCAGLRPKTLIGEKRVRSRVLDDAELRAVWFAAERTPYPMGPFYRLLLLTGARKSEASDAAWSEFDLDKGTWTVPEERFKSGVTHRVPLSRDAIALLADLPRWAGEGGPVFSTDGKAPVNGHSKSKARLDRHVTEFLGRETDWQIHDLRRTVRTRLAGLGIPDTVAEQIIGHGRKGLARVYDQHGYEDEMRDALERWAARLRSIVQPPPENVVKLGRKRAS
jgi:integrase